jgi:hypothetical protein
MNEIHEFDTVIYPRKLWIVVKPEKGQLEDVFDDLDYDEVLSERWNATAIYLVREKKFGLLGGLIVFKNKREITIENITHEATHIAMDMFTDLGIEFNGASQEAFAYFVGWVASCCEQVKINNYNERIHRTR